MTPMIYTEAMIEATAMALQTFLDEAEVSVQEVRLMEDGPERDAIIATYATDKHKEQVKTCLDVLSAHYLLHLDPGFHERLDELMEKGAGFIKFG
jgi:hypothetical protein